MYVPDIELHEAGALDEAADLLARLAPDVRMLAGGTDLLVDLKTGRTQTKHVISLRRLTALRGVTLEGEALRIGALTTPNELARSALVPEHFSPLLEAVSRLAATQVRNMATVGGNIASAVPSADLPPILIALGASAILYSRAGERTVPLDAFFLGPRRTVLRRDELLIAIRVPLPLPGFGAAYERFALREANACAVAAVAASLQLGRARVVSDARVVLCAVAPLPRVVAGARAALVGRLAGEDTFEAAAVEAMAAAEPISDIRASADYRRTLVGILARRALRTARSRAEDRV